jgi:hypothetical protein
LEVEIKVYGCVNGRWALKAPDAKLLNQEGSVIGQHFAGPTWQLNDGSWIKGKCRAAFKYSDPTKIYDLTTAIHRPVTNSTI